ncbi:hypothetical protein ALNOE001_10380 [Candidatus Methanobinarius endosymbioticus]|uniref:Uncharacterized protein n=1 Tax=Candidatus Methanobinarius endosymbioticus TaxID=2006182 RepID=A0A366MBM0_9EURY|nr:hypothetical protein ALNOE001_10380 [Candidatus Methanobinarius endosymbioticus]
MKKTTKKLNTVFSEAKHIFEDNPNITTQFINDKDTYDAESIKKTSKTQRNIKKQSNYVKSLDKINGAKSKQSIFSNKM